MNTILKQAVLVMALFAPGLLQADSLPKRETPIPPTTKGIPHKQFSGEAVPAIHEELMRRVALLPKVDIRPTVVSMPGATGFWLLEDLALERPEVIVGGREFAHVHPDGSLHASLPPARAYEAVDAGWAVRHPWADQRAGWEGFVLLYTPQNDMELDIVTQLIIDGYNFITGADVAPDDLRGG